MLRGVQATCADSLGLFDVLFLTVCRILVSYVACMLVHKAGSMLDAMSMCETVCLCNAGHDEL